ncbi:MAG: hypothetical protein JSS60_07540 [Verrucomicrobia bacterium]|nr:hypothetical protein [Verrucomicrobiota bacterium]
MNLLFRKQFSHAAIAAFTAAALMLTGCSGGSNMTSKASKAQLGDDATPPTSDQDATPDSSGQNDSAAPEEDSSDQSSS